MSLTIKELSVGQKAQFTKTMSESDVYLFAGITGDFNPAHINEEHSKNTMFKNRIVHGMLTASLISTVFGMYLPGPGAIFLENNARFLKPVYIGDTLTAEVEVSELIVEKNISKFITKVTNQDGQVVLEGSAVLMPRKEGK